MRCPPAITDESGRLLSLAQYGLDEKHGLPDLDPIVKIATQLLGFPAAAINMIGDDHVFFAASAGIGDCDMRRDVSFCAHAIAQREVMVVLDATQDERFHDNPLVTAPTPIRFYAGAPLRSPSDHPLGALCIVDSFARESFSPKERSLLEELASLAIDKLERRRLEYACLEKRYPFEQIAENSPMPVFSFLVDRQVRLWNVAAAAAFGYQPGEIVGRSFRELLSDVAEAAFRRAIEAVEPQPRLRDEVRRATLRHKNGSLVIIDFLLFAIIHEGIPQFGVIVSQATPSHDPAHLAAAHSR
ncbi:MAG TPA: GAF domain-containing protein [Acidobacteriaceae bacterium]